MTDNPTKPPIARRTDWEVYRVSECEVPQDLLTALEASEPGPESEAVEQELAQEATDEVTEAQVRGRAEIDKSLGLDD